MRPLLHSDSAASRAVRVVPSASLFAEGWQGRVVVSNPATAAASNFPLEPRYCAAVTTAPDYRSRDCLNDRRRSLEMRSISENGGLASNSSVGCLWQW
mmetsp:Transcript_60751/g.140325  ORF Transcript_60751/g.140325 Transcript_60751/m.140325 type:complete len:98 (-) Transcript_60751:47-340(-)